jgi:hypothetical protein
MLDIVPARRLMNTSLLLRFRHLLVLFIGSLVLIGATVAAPVASAKKTKLVKIVATPPATSANPSAVFRMKRARRAKILCRIDNRPYRTCRVRVKYKGVRPGKHIFRVKARRNGRTTSARHRWSVVGRGAPLPPPPGKLVFDDEFNGTTLDKTQWAAWNSAGYRGNGVRRPSAVAVSGGNLVITARSLNGQLVSGGMSAYRNFKYGRVQFRVKTEKDPRATMSGIVMTWPKFQRSPDFTENDIYETGPVADRHELNTFIHYGKGVTTQKLYRHNVNASVWRTMTMDWRKDELKIYRDGKLMWAVTDRYAIPDVLHHVCIQLDAFFNRTLLQPVRMYVDYVRIWE